MRYTVLLGDGDSSTYPHILKVDPYPGIVVQKRECTNHLKKRLTKGLDGLVMTERVKGNTLGGSSYGALTKEKIVRLGNYYHSAIKKNAPSVRKTRTAIIASYRHCMSTNERPCHGLCPSGIKSWCFYNRALAAGKKPPDHKSSMKTYIRAEIVAKMKPIYDRLSTDDLLDRCMKLGTQNSNESLHQSIWVRCQKIKASTLKKVEVCKIDIILLFNKMDQLYN